MSWTTNFQCNCTGEKKNNNKGSMHLQGALAPEKVKPVPEGRYTLSPILMPQPIFVHIYWVGFTFSGAFSVFRVLRFLGVFFIFA